MKKRPEGSARELAIKMLFPEAERYADLESSKLSRYDVLRKPTPMGVKAEGSCGRPPSLAALRGVWWSYFFHKRMHELGNEAGIRNI